MPSFGEMLRRVRMRKGLSQAELARRLGVVRQQINNYESDRFTPSWDMAVRIAKALDVSLDAFVEGRLGDDAEGQEEPAALAAMAG